MVGRLPVNRFPLASLREHSYIRAQSAKGKECEWKREREGERKRGREWEWKRGRERELDAQFHKPAARGKVPDGPLKVVAMQIPIAIRNRVSRTTLE